MKNILFLIAFFLPLQRIFALNIAQISVSSFSENEINIGLNTEAVELYYFQSWHYTVSESTITLEVCFIPGFGSKIAFLNNNFQIPISNSLKESYHLIVKVYYTFYNPESLQDVEEGSFSTPLADMVVLTNNHFITNETVFFPNPTNGKLYANHPITQTELFDNDGRMLELFNGLEEIIDLSNKSEGHYFLRYLEEGRYKVTRVIIKK